MDPYRQYILSANTCWGWRSHPSAGVFLFICDTFSAKNPVQAFPPAKKKTPPPAEEQYFAYSKWGVRKTRAGKNLFIASTCLNCISSLISGQIHSCVPSWVLRIFFTNSLARSDVGFSKKSLVGPDSMTLPSSRNSTLWDTLRANSIS